jgi:plasmid stabilization system protein ParE
MACKVVWTEQARDDLREIVQFIARDNRQAAERFGNAIIFKAESLADFPRMGRVVPEIGDDLTREIIHGSYRIIYELNEAAHSLAISRVWHAARGTPELQDDISSAGA